MTDSTALQIDNIEEAHIDAVMDIDARSFARPWSRAMWHRELQDPQRVHLVARRAGSVVGHGGLMLVVDEAHMTTVATALDHRRTGVGRGLVYALIATARGRGAESMILEVRASDRGAQRLYSRFGFAPAGLRRDYYSAPADDAVVMWLDDLGGDAVGARLARLAESTTLDLTTRTDSTTLDLGGRVSQRDLEEQGGRR